MPGMGNSARLVEQLFANLCGPTLSGPSHLRLYSLFSGLFIGWDSPILRPRFILDDRLQFHSKVAVVRHSGAVVCSGLDSSRSLPAFLIPSFPIVVN